MIDKNLPKPVIVPFEKYRGQPVQALMHDEEYIKWLTAQDWFKEKFQNIYTIIINNFKEVADTPEHNKMQVKFLNENYRLKVAYRYLGPQLFRYNQTHFDQNIGEFLRTAKAKCLDFKEILNGIKRLEGNDLISQEGPKFEEKGIDVIFRIKYGYGHIGIGEANDRSCGSLFEDEFWNWGGYLNFKIELKPHVGDDFPGILRQMKADKSEVLIYGSYTGSGASEQEFKDYFTSQKIAVLSEIDIENTVLPDFDKTLKVDPNSVTLTEFSS